MHDSQLERRIITGMIVSDEFIREISRVYNSSFITGPALQQIATWCMEYFNKYEKAPFRDIEDIYYNHMARLNKGLAEKIETDILPELSEEYEQEHFNHQYLLDQTKAYFKKRNLELHAEQIKGCLEEDELTQAEELAYSYNTVAEQTEGLTLNDPEQLDSKLSIAFQEAQNPLIYYPGAIGQFLNDQLVRGGFVSLLAPEKRGKSFLLMDMALRANRQGCNVVFFQAGDMTEAQMLRRIAVYLTKIPLKEKFCGECYMPVEDCYYNQTNQCSNNDRETEYDLFAPEDFKEDEISREKLIERFEDNPGHTPCTSHSCPTWQQHGALWLQKETIKGPLTEQKAKKKLNKLFSKRKATFKLSTHANGTLTVGEIRSLLSTWEKQEDFVPDVIIIDYADLLEPEKGMKDFRHQLNEIWKGMRRVTEEQHCLLVTATQADAQSYETGTLKLKNFSEDKRKLSHVTAMYGLNQDPQGKEKQKGILRLNELVVREDDLESKRQVKVLQRLQIGRPVCGSFF